MTELRLSYSPIAPLGLELQYDLNAYALSAQLTHQGFSTDQADDFLRTWGYVLKHRLQLIIRPISTRSTWYNQLALFGRVIEITPLDSSSVQLENTAEFGFQFNY